MQLLKKFSPTGNRTPASRVTGGDTDHYTIEDLMKSQRGLDFFQRLFFILAQIQIKEMFSIKLLLEYSWLTFLKNIIEAGSWHDKQMQKQN